MDTIGTAIAAVAAGRPVVVVDDEDRENEGDLIIAAELVDPATMSFLVRHTSGFVCVALPQDECERLALPPLHHSNSDSFGTAYRVTVDAVDGVSTGISARDRASTARLLASASTLPAQLSRPGHVVPLAARSGGVLERGGHTEAAVDLTRLAGLRPAGVLCEIVSVRDPGRMAQRDELVDFATEHDLPIVTIADLARHRRATEQPVERVVTTGLPTSAGNGRTVGYRASGTGAEHLAFVTGDIAGARDVPVHVHVECLLGDVFGSLRCRCSGDLDTAMREITATGRGVVVYLRPGTRSPLLALQEQDAQVSRLDGRADIACTPFTPADAAVTTAILADLGVGSARHLHNSLSVQTALCARVPDAAATAGSEARPSGAVA
ncbi:3,4-dihydroxy-2-butanone-4-phosphate synthase [Pseudonocardia sp. KRD291]|uniref:3,4-dihydroxy-2-butanone-4-phosphate synthase n=1 Tax=Pseudonocardia sp. KRD291 TaxID=2792007 RepID=UPI001C4A2B09|nr:3,4-dihydroxy-2-butanone-4-phosphate synthase [Pseudonocardia sp. KRD291]MBW0102048.1 3,4-dihydroxy-2-butanone-4-phosphate synthase [Pseudonocardia sp. KRD291]